MSTKAIIYGVLALLVVAGIYLYVRNRNGSNNREAIKCCTSRDAFCKCTAWKWSASADCDHAPCGGSSRVREEDSPRNFTGTVINGQVYNTPRASETNTAGATWLASIASGTPR